MTTTRWLFGVLVLGLAVLGTSRRDDVTSPEPRSAAGHPDSSQARLVRTRAPAVPLASSTWRRTPLLFVENQGQCDDDVQFVARQGAMTAFLTRAGFRLALLERGRPPAGDGLGLRTPSAPRDMDPAASDTLRRGANVFLTFEGASPDVRVLGVDEQLTRFSYFLGNDPAEWRSDVPSYAAVRYSGLYPGIDFVVREGDGRLEYDLILDAEADLGDVVMRCEGVDHMAVADDGGAVLGTALGPLRLSEPKAWYEDESGKRDAVACHYRQHSTDTLAFAVDEPSRGRRLVVDPQLEFGTYLGGSFQEYMFAVAVSPEGEAYVAGQSWSADYPVTPGAMQSTMSGNGDAVVTRMSAAGDAILNATFIGGTDSTESPRAIVLTPSGDVIIGGSTQSPDFPTTPSALSSTLMGFSDGYLVRLSGDLTSLVYGTYFGGAGTEGCSSMDVDDLGGVYLTGTTDSPDFPTTSGAFDTLNTGSDDPFVMKFDAGSTLVYSTFVGGDGATDWGIGIAVDDAGCVYVTGRTSSIGGFPVTLRAFDTTPNGSNDVFVAKLDADGSDLVYATYLGGSDYEEGWGIDVDAAGSAYVTGFTYSFDFPTTPGAFDTLKIGFSDIFVTKVATGGDAIVYGTLLGTAGDHDAFGIAVDDEEFAHVVGVTKELLYPVTPDAFAPAGSGTIDTVVTRITPWGDGLAYSTYLGGTGTSADTGRAIALGPDGGFYVVGQTMSLDFPTTTGAWDPTLGGFSDGWLVKFPRGPWSNYGLALAGSTGKSSLSANGDLVAGSPGSLFLANAPSSAAATLIVGVSKLEVAFKGGTLLPAPLLLVPLVTDVAGELSLAWSSWPAGVPANTKLYFQTWITDPGGPKGLSASNGLLAIAP